MKMLKMHWAGNVRAYILLEAIFVALLFCLTTEVKGQSPCDGLDIVFVVDNSGSMGVPYKGQLEDILTTAEKRGGTVELREGRARPTVLSN
jgi:hypothetical protein